MFDIRFLFAKDFQTCTFLGAGYLVAIVLFILTGGVQYKPQLSGYITSLCRAPYSHSVRFALFGAQQEGCSGYELPIEISPETGLR